MTSLVFISIPFLILTLGFACIQTLFRGLKGDDPNGHVSTWLAFAVGLILFSYYWFFTGLAGLLTRGSFWVLFFIGILLVFVTQKEWRNLFSRLKTSLTLFRFQRIVGWLLLAELISVLLLTLIRCWAFYIEGDSLVYHLYLPKQFVLQAKIWAVPYSEHVFWPLFSEVLFTVGELFQSLLISKWISYGVYLATVVLVGNYVYRRTDNVTASLLTAALVASSPVFFFHAPSTYNDLFFNFFMLAGFLLYETLCLKSPISKTGMFLCGLLWGAALACKYVVFFGLMAFAPILLFDFIRCRYKKNFLLAVFFLCLGVFLTSAPYYLRSYMHYGNPVFPFASELFQTPFGYVSEEAKWLGANAVADVQGAGRNIKQFLLLPWNLTFHPELFLNDKIGFVFLPLSFLILFSLKHNRRLLFYCFFYSLIWFSIAQITRYFLPVLTLSAIMIGFGYSFIEKRFLRGSHLALWLAVILLSVQVLWAGYHAHKDFLLREREDIIEVAEDLNRMITDSDEEVLVVGDDRLYYFDFVGFREKTFRNFTHYPDFKSSTETVSLLDREGINRILIVRAHQKQELGSKSFPVDPLQYFGDLIAGGYYDVERSFRTREATYTLTKRSQLHI